METVRPRQVPEPPSVEWLLHLFVTGTNRVPCGAYEVRTRSALPHSDLKSVVFVAQQKHRAWCAWTDDKNTWLFTAEMSLALSRERGVPVLEVCAFSECGELKETGFWAHGKDGTWQRCTD
jgi:hypothetical protein